MRLIDADALLHYLWSTLADLTEEDGAYEWAWVDAIHEIEHAPTVNGWISVKDRLPEEPGRYLCWFGKNTFAVGASIVPYIPDLHWFASLESLERYENVTHWMPLPESPKEENDE